MSSDRPADRGAHTWPYLRGRSRLLGATVSVFDSGRVQVTPSMKHVTGSLAVKTLAQRLGELHRDYETLNPDVGVEN